MKGYIMYKQIFFMIFFIGFFTLNSNSLKASETSKGMQKDYEAFKKEMSKKMDELEADLKQLKTKAQGKGSKVKQETIEELETAQKKLKKKMKELKEDSKDQWSTMKKSMSETLDNIHSKIQKSLEE